MAESDITIKTRSKFRPLRVVYALAAQVTVVGVGVWANSPAMQWAGFVFLMVLVAAIAVALAANDEGLTIKEARARLDEIEKDGAQ